MIQWWYRGKRADNRDDSLLLSIIAEFERDGMTFASALDYCPELLVKDGILTRRAPTAAERTDIEFGWNLAKEMGRLDVGQSVAVKEKAALAIEAIEGTDRCIERAGLLCRAGGWVLVKVAKPQQDMRFDVPTIGVTTIENLHKARARVLAIDAGRTILLDQPEVVALADRYGLSIVAL
jgi:UDP-2,3-diacylglucosamine hydrolase